MSISIGALAIMGAASQAAYETPVDATDKVPLLSESLDNDVQNILQEALMGSAAIPDIQQVFVPVGGSIEAVVPYTFKSGSDFISTSLLIAAGMGTNNTYDAANSANQLVLADRLDEALTIAIDKQVNASYAWEIIGSMISSFTLGCTASESLKFGAEIQSNFLNISSSGNTPTELAALPDDLINYANFDHMCFRIADQDDALQASDQYGISAFTLNVGRTLTDAQQLSCDQSNVLGYNHANTQRPIQPVVNGFRAVTLEITIPRYLTDQFRTWQANGTRLQGDIVFTDPSANAYKFSILMPHLKVTTPTSAISGPEAANLTVSFQLLKINSASDVTFEDATAIVGELGIETIDARTAVILD